MEDTSFIDLTKEENLKRMNINSELIIPFKNVMYNLQEIFNRDGYTTKINYKEFFEHAALGEEEYDKNKILNSKKFKEYIEKVNRLRSYGNLGNIDIEEGYLMFLSKQGILTISILPVSKSKEINYKVWQNKISIDETYLNSPDLESLLAHEFIHFITEFVYGDLVPVSTPYMQFHIECLTELLTHEAYPNANGYNILGRLIQFSRDVLQIKDFTFFLKREMNPKYTEEWNIFFKKSNDFFLKNNNKYTGYSTICDVDKEDIPGIIDIQRTLIIILINGIDYSRIEKIQYIKEKIKEVPYLFLDREYITEYISFLDSRIEELNSTLETRKL